MDQSDFSTDEGFARAQQRLEDINRQAQQNQRRARDLSDSVSSIVATARSARGEVTVRARVGGRLAGLEFGTGAEELSLSALAQITLETIAQAQHRAMADLADRGAELFGAESDIARGLRSDADSGFPSPGLRM